MNIYVKYIENNYSGGSIIIAAGTKKVAEKLASKNLNLWNKFSEAKIIPGASYNGVRGKILVSSYYAE